MSFWENRNGDGHYPTRVGRTAKQKRRSVPRRSYYRPPEERPQEPALKRWFLCVVMMLTVTALNFLPFTWAASCKDYLAYCFQPGAALGTKWAAWADWQPANDDIVMVWKRLVNRRFDDDFIYPCAGQIIYAYAWRHHPLTGQVEMHYGIDIQGEEGAAIQAAKAGIVTEILEEQQLGLVISLDHGNGFVTRYGHLQKALVEPGAQIEKGQQIATMGTSGQTDDVHVHFEILVDGQPIDPLTLLP